MFNISREFAPPFKLIAPFFVGGAFYFLLSFIALLFLKTDYSFLGMETASWLHLFLVGYVMMIIFGAMAQLVPVVLEVGHYSVDFYYIIFPLLAIGVLFMFFGFLTEPFFIAIGGVLLIVSMSIFSVEVFLTLKKASLKSFTVFSLKVSNVFLQVGILVGFFVALTLLGYFEFSIEKIVFLHICLIIGGYIFVTTMGISLILLPMFGLSHGFDEKSVNIALKFLIAGIFVAICGGLSEWFFLKSLGEILILIGVLFYLYQVYLIHKKRARKEWDIWAKSIYFSYGALIVAVIFGFLYILSSKASFLYAFFWSLIVGFYTFLINGHLYKIIPFLVWFHRYAPLVGKRKVPMLHQMYPKKKADYHFYFGAIGTFVSLVGLVIGNWDIFKGGISFLIISAFYLVISVFEMLNYGKGDVNE